MIVIKADGRKVPFEPQKIRTWVRWAVNNLENQIEMEYYILKEVLKRLPENEIKTSEIHRAIINVCIDKEEVEYSRVAANLEIATIHKKQSELLNIFRPDTASFMDFVQALELEGLYSGDWLTEINEENESLVNSWFDELESRDLEYWTVKQWSDKYSKKLKGYAVETPALGALANAIGYHGVTPLAFQVAQDIMYSKLNLPTPSTNGVRDGSFDSISCCVIESEDTTESLDVAEHIASRMTAKKAGIGIMLNTRSKGDSVRNGSVEHLGKAPLYRSLEAAVKKYTQVTRGGSATMTMRCIDPDIMDMLRWKTQKIDLAQRIDKIDYEMAYNDAFVHAILREEDWYLFSYHMGREVHDAFHYEAEEYMEVVKKAVQAGIPYTKVKAIDVLQQMLEARGETGRTYVHNVTTSNRHTPFIDTIKQSNLCMEIMLPTKGFKNMNDLYVSEKYRKMMESEGYGTEEKQHGEVAFCSLAALNVAAIEDEEYFEVAERALRTVEQMIQKAPMMTPVLRKSLLERRSVGIGIIGLASKLYKAGLDYDGSEESLAMVAQTSELHMYALYKASQKMSKETGIVCKGVDFDWIPTDTRTGTREYFLDWESIRGVPRMHSVLVAYMPTESSAPFTGADNGPYPARRRVNYKKARRGKVQFISEYFINKLSAYDVDMIPYYGEMQDWVDQAISADHYTNFTKLPNRKIKMESLVEWFVNQSMRGNKTAYYQNFLDTKGEVEMEETCADGCKL